MLRSFIRILIPVLFGSFLVLITLPLAAPVHSVDDVAAALRAGAKSVDAIEIDPAILLAGKMDHSEKPYNRK